MFKYNFYFVLSLAVISIPESSAMQHKWTKSKGSHKKAQIHHASQSQGQSKRENAKQKKLAALESQAASATAQEQISTLVGIMTLQAATQHRAMPTRR